jgi:hypothetical protein
LSDTVEDRPGAWSVATDGQAIDLYVADAPRMPRYALRMIREAMLRTYENADGIVFHAAGADLAGHAVMICGGPSAGKTTTLAALLSATRGAGSLLSNDRLIVHGAGRVVAVPLPVPLARGTVESFAPLRGTLSPAALAALSREFATRDKTVLPARDFAAAFGSDLVAGSRLHALLVPRFTDTTQPVRIRQMTSEETLAALAQACFTPTDEFWRPWLITRKDSDTTLAHSAAALCASLAATVPCHEIAFGVRAPIDDLHRALADLIGDLQ